MNISVFILKGGRSLVISGDADHIHIGSSGPTPAVQAVWRSVLLGSQTLTCPRYWTDIADGYPPNSITRFAAELQLRSLWSRLFARKLECKQNDLMWEIKCEVKAFK